MQKIVLFVVVFFLAFQSCIATSGITSNDIDSNLPTLLMTDAPKIEKEPVRIQSVFGTSNLKEFSLPFEDGYPMGPFEKLDEAQYLFISKCGDIHFAKLDSEIVLTKTGKKLSKFIPGNEKSTVESDAKNVVYCRDLSGVKDSLLINNSLFVAYTVWDDQFNGVRLAVSEFELDKEAHELIFKREIYLSRPAIKEPILGHQVGGKLAVGENDHILYLSIGDFSKPERVQDNTTSIGKVIRIDLKRLNAEVFASGLRSPSGGLMYDRESNELWLTEHGPRGGDEINLIKRNKNYGWPIVSYGTIYERDGMGNYYGNQFNSHEGYEKPVMTFLPSIGIGPIAKYASTGKNDYWDNNYFFAGMASKTLYRAKKEGANFVYAEPVLTGYRIRALKIDPQGVFYIRTDDNQFLISE
ncbi:MULTISPECIES: PQQ-dependent sugar dehydrogenase [Methylotenera]|uniref:PQQ-dependent sugar dehydrogenase n=1 Tax=Methylotenera TaxID=359407 RepID=UPI000366384F|nr:MULTISPECIES: PQQ-dependent sugar dehydrogenase [Methylotenera]